MGLHPGMRSKRPRDRCQGQKVVTVPGQAAEHQKYMERLQALREGRNTAIASPTQVTPDLDSSGVEPVSFDDNLNFSVPSPHLEIDDVEPEPLPNVKAPKRMRRSKPDLTMERLYQHWTCLLPTLVGPYANYHARTLAKPLGRIPPTLSLCTQPTCIKKTTSIICLLFDRRYFQYMLSLYSSKSQISRLLMSLVAHAQPSHRFSLTSDCSLPRRLSLDWPYLSIYSASIGRCSSAHVTPSMLSLLPFVHTIHVADFFW